jgi:TRAP-type C4-dicarboxylate transport system permease small subunit
LSALLTRLDAAGRYAENAVLVVLLVGMMVLAVGQIVLRELFSTGVIWADELIRLIVLWLAMFGSIAACRDNRHIRIDVLSHLLPPRGIAAVRGLVDLFAAVVCGFIAWHAWRYLGLEMEFGDTVLTGTPAWLAHAVVPLGFAVMAYRFIVQAVAAVIPGGPRQLASAP